MKELLVRILIGALLAAPGGAYDREVVFGLTNESIIPSVVAHALNTGSPVYAVELQLDGGASEVKGLEFQQGRHQTIGGGYKTPLYFLTGNPADGKTQVLSNSPERHYWGFYTIRRHPVTGVLYALVVDATKNNPPPMLVTIDPVTFNVSTIGPASGIVGGFAIDAQGNAVVSTGGGGIRALDLATGMVSGTIVVPWIVGTFDDLVYDSDGRLWGTLQAQNKADRGLWVLHPTSPTFVHVWQMDQPYWSLAVGTIPDPVVYCTGKTNSLGCIPSIASYGIPSPTATSGFTISASEVRNDRVGLLIYGTSGRAAFPFHGGVLCLAAPKRAWTVDSGGSAPPVKDCSGEWAIDFNAFIHQEQPPPPVTLPGTVVECQWWGRDTPGNASLSNAIEFTQAP